MNDYHELLQEENMELLRANPLLKGLADDEIAAFLQHAAPDYIELEPEHSITVLPGSARKIGLVIKGDVTVCTVDYSGARTVLNVLHDPGPIGGMQFMIDRYNIVYEITANNAARLIMLDPDALLNANPDMILIQHRILVNTMRSQRDLFLRVSEHLLCLSQKSIRGKLLRYLQLKSETAQSYEFDIPLSREDLAAYLAVDRASLSRSLGELKQEGVIEFRKNHFKILDTKYFRYE